MRLTDLIFVVRAFCIISCLALLEISADAQAPKSKNPGGRLGFAMYSFVQKEIGIANDAETRAKLQAWGEAALKKQAELRATTKGDQDQYLAEGDRNIDLEYRDDLKKLLTVDQYKRVREIQLSMMGYRDVTDPEVIEALELKPDQIKQIGSAQRDRVVRLKEYDAKANDRKPRLSGEEYTRGSKELDAAFSQKVEEILSKDQQAKFREMQGPSSK